jgi:hypothetical protein
MAVDPNRRDSPEQVTSKQPLPLRDWVGALLRENKTLVAIELLIVPVLLGLKAAGVLRNPYLLLLLFGWLSVWVRRVGWRRVGLGPPASWARTVTAGVVIGIGYNAFDILGLLPVLHRLTGEPLDLEQLSSLRGNLGLLLLYLIASWSLFAFGEELAYRGYLLNRMTDLFGTSTAGWTAGVALVSLAFGVQHLDQGVTGVVGNIVGGIVLAIMYLASGRSLWLPIVAHGVEDSTSLMLLYFGYRP